MPKLYIPPPSVEHFLDQVVEWFARNLSCKITITLEYKDGTNSTLSYDARKQP